MNHLEEYRRAVSEPSDYVRQLKEASGKKIIGYTCSYTPEEVIMAAGAQPLRLFGTKQHISLADSHLQSYCCSVVRGILEEGLSGRVDYLDGMVFPHTCDSIQRLSDVWRLNLVRPFHVDVVLPVKLSTPSARQYLLDVLKKFKTDLERGLNREITEAGLIHAVKIYNAIRALMTSLYQLRCENPQIITGQDFHTIIRAAMIMEREAFLEALGAIVSELTKSASEKKPSHAKRLVLSGGICNHPDIYDAIEAAGGIVVGDDLCTGSRYFEGVINENLPPLDAIVKRYAERAVCPAKHAGLTQRGENLVKTVRGCRADGVVFLLLKFCDPHAFDYPYIKETLDREKIPSLLLEMEEQTQAGGQLQTRLETFIQIL